jgi:hypothetical protein
MTPKLPQHIHESYLKHRKQRTWQIILPVVLSSMLCLALIVLINLATFQQGGDVARWAAISTIWIVIPIMLGLLLTLAVLAGIIYLLARLLNVTPTYTGLAQDYVHLGALYVQRATEAVVRQVIQLQGVLASVQRFFQKLKT